MEDIVSCTIHDNTSADGQCFICHGYFCDDCLFEQDLLIFCKDHLESYQSRKWTALKSVVSTSESPEAGVELYELKKTLWNDQRVFCYIETKYELCESKNIIESHVTLYVDSDHYSQLRGP